MDSTLLRFASLLLISLTSSANPNSDYNSLVYTKCANRTFATPPTKSQVPRQTLSSLLQQLTSHSSQSKFYRHAEAGLDNNEAGSARVQLHGCYVHYELDGVDSEPFNDRLMHKTYGEDLANGVAAVFEEMRDAAFAALESEVAGGGGFCKTGYEAVQVMAQCSGGLGGCECGKCVGRAVQIAEEECGGAVSGQIYLEEC
ncbi:hypothetical protein ACFXTH_010608 [Malus domestica]